MEKKSKMKTIEIELSDCAASILTEMARRGKVTPEAIARVSLEHTLSQAIDRLIAVDGDEWFLWSARDPNKACLKSWEEVEKPGDYATALKCGRQAVNGRCAKSKAKSKTKPEAPEFEDEISDNEAALFLLQIVAHDMKDAGLRVLHEPETKATLVIGEVKEPITLDSIRHLQTTLSKRFGTDINTECGEATLSIAHDRVLLTNAGGIVIAERDGSIARQLTDRKPELLVV
jgi:hypothetical protein